MDDLVIRNLDDETARALRERASSHGWTPEDEARALLRKAVLAPPPQPPRDGSEVDRQAWVQMMLQRAQAAAGGRAQTDSGELQWRMRDER